MINRLFVYGTLKTDTKLLEELVGKDYYHLLGKGSIRGKRLEGTPYPAVVRDDAGEEITGELIELKDFPEAIVKLDAYEAFYPDNIEQSLYKRELVSVTMQDGQITEAWVYYYNR